MNQYIKHFFRDERQFRLFFILCMSTVFDCILVAFRIHKSKFDWSQVQTFSDFVYFRGTYGTFLFLVWNLFLAWVPYWFALSLDFATRIKKDLSIYSIGFLLFMWLLFFPNAPYIVTDLIHLEQRPNVPFWYDMMMLISFAWTGLILGYSSLFEVQRFLETRYSRNFAHFTTISAIWLGGFGVYLGRFQRWNSWDVFTNPLGLIRQQVDILLNPMAHWATLGVAIVLSVFMMVGYFTLNALRRV